jgi:hypothetical protein
MRLSHGEEGSRVARRVAAVGLVALLAAGAGGAALAQVGAPTVLGPATDAPATGTGEGGRPTEGQGPGAAVPAPSGTTVPERAPSGIEVAPLPEVRSDYAGALGPEEGGLGTEMWRGTDRALLVRLLPSLPATARSPAMRDLMRRLLLSSAIAPRGDAEAPDSNLFSLRAERLVAMGDYQGAAKLLRLIPERETDATAARFATDALLFANDLDAACAQVDRWIRAFDDVYWQKALIFCQTHAGEYDEAALGVGLLREQGRADDEAFFTLVDALSGVESARVKSLPIPTALHLAMMQAAKQPLPESVLETEDPAALAWIATAPGADPALRLAAAERAAEAGALSAEALARVYAEQPLEPRELDNALSLAEEEPGQRSRAALYQAVVRTEQPLARATLLETALRLAREQGRYQTAVRVYRPFLIGLEPAPELAWFALDVGRALHLLGEAGGAERWLALVQAQASRDPQAAAATSALWLLTRIAGDGRPLVWDADSVRAWRDNQAAGGDEQAGQRAARLFAIFEAFGEPVGAAWRVLADGSPPVKQSLPNPALWFILDDAAAAGRVGETVLLTLISLGPDGPGETNPIILSRALASLQAVGLEAEARALALEAAVASGV